MQKQNYCSLKEGDVPVFKLLLVSYYEETDTNQIIDYFEDKLLEDFLIVGKH